MERPSALVRQLGLVSAIALVVSNMVGTGIFSTSGFLASDLGDPKIFFGIWIVGAIVSLAGALCYSELGINFPSSGGEYVYLTHAYGKPWGFMTGWASLFAGFSAPIAAAALASANYLAYFFPALKQEAAMAAFGPSWFEVRIGGAQLAAAALIGVLTVINILGVARAARFQNAMTAFKLGVLLIFILLGLSIGTGDWSHFSQPAERGSTTPLAGQFAISLCFIYMAYSGWNAATYIAEELKNPAVTLPRALTIGTLLVAALFLMMNVVYVYAAPLEEMKGVLAIGSLASSKLFGPGVAGIFSLAMAISLVPTVNAMVTIGPRVYYAMAKNGAFLSFAARVDDRWRTPVPAIALQGCVAVLMTLTPFPSLLTFIGLTLNFFTAMSVASLFLFRRRPEWKKLGAVSFAWPLLPVFFCTVGLWVSVYGFLFAPRVSFATAAMLGAGALIYHWRTRNERRQPAYGD
jgi:APA family basic amino acid/polyamine antiporter